MTLPPGTPCTASSFTLIRLTPETRTPPAAPTVPRTAHRPRPPRRPAPRSSCRALTLSSSPRLRAPQPSPPCAVRRGPCPIRRSLRLLSLGRYWYRHPRIVGRWCECGPVLPGDGGVNLQQEIRDIGFLGNCFLGCSGGSCLRRRATHRLILLALLLARCRRRPRCGPVRLRHHRAGRRVRRGLRAQHGDPASRPLEPALVAGF